MDQADYVPNAIRALITNANLNPSTKHVSATYTALIGELVGHPPRPIPLAARAVDLEERADHLATVITALSGCLTASLNDARRMCQAVSISVRSRLCYPISRPTRAALSGTPPKRRHGGLHEREAKSC